MASSSGLAHGRTGLPETPPTGGRSPPRACRSRAESFNRQFALVRTSALYRPAEPAEPAVVGRLRVRLRPLGLQSPHMIDEIVVRKARLREFLVNIQQGETLELASDAVDAFGCRGGGGKRDQTTRVRPDLDAELVVRRPRPAAAARLSASPRSSTWRRRGRRTIRRKRRGSRAEILPSPL